MKSSGKPGKAGERDNPSMSDVAALVGVSIKTVSGALTGGDARMSRATRAKILAAADELGYVPNIAARGVRQGWMPILAVVADGLLTSPFATDIMRGLDSGARRHAFSLFAVNIVSAERAEASLPVLRGFRPRHTIYATSYHKVLRLPQRLAEATDAMVNCRDADGRIPSIVPDEDQAGYDIASHLLTTGRRRILFLSLPGLSAMDLRLAGIVRAHRDIGVPFADGQSVDATRARIYNPRVKSRVWEILKDKIADMAPDAILCGNDRIALEVYSALNSLGISIPGDMAVASFDNQEDIATRVFPALTTMALPHREMGARASDLLLSGAAIPSKLMKVPFRLVLRGST